MVDEIVKTGEVIMSTKNEEERKPLKVTTHENIHAHLQGNVKNPSLI